MEQPKKDPPYNQQPRLEPSKAHHVAAGSNCCSGAQACSKHKERETSAQREKSVAPGFNTPDARADNPTTGAKGPAPCRIQVLPQSCTRQGRPAHVLKPRTHVTVFCQLTGLLVTVAASTGDQGSSRLCGVLPATRSATTGAGMSVSPPPTARRIIAVASAERSCLRTARIASVFILASCRSARSRRRSSSGVAARVDAAVVVSMLPPASTAVRILLRASAAEAWRRESLTKAVLDSKFSCAPDRRLRAACSASGRRADAMPRPENTSKSSRAFIAWW